MEERNKVQEQNSKQNLKMSDSLLIME